TRLRTLIDAAFTPQLRELLLASGSFGRAGLQIIREHPVRRQLSRLDLGENALGQGPRGLEGFPILPRLESLNLYQNHVSAEGVRQLAGAAGLTSLRALDLGRNPLSWSGGEA